MAGMSLNMGLGSQGAFGSGYGGAATPAAAGASPQGPTSIGQKAFGIVTGGSPAGPKTAPLAFLGSGIFSLIALFVIYHSLPR